MVERRKHQRVEEYTEIATYVPSYDKEETIDVVEESISYG